MNAFLFDLDGTLSDSVPQIMHTLRRTFDDMGMEATDEELMLTIGVPLVDTGENFLGKGRGLEFADRYRALFLEDDPMFPIRAFDGIPEMLRALRAKGGKIALVTAKREVMTYEALDAMGIRDLFDAVIHSGCSQKHKPDPEPAFVALNALNAEPRDGCFIGDSIHDMGCGKNAGLATVAVTWGAGLPDQLREVKPDHVADTVAELEAILLDMM